MAYENKIQNSKQLRENIQTLNYIYIIRKIFFWEYINNH